MAAPSMQSVKITEKRKPPAWSLFLVGLLLFSGIAKRLRRPDPVGGQNFMMGDVRASSASKSPANVAWTEVVRLLYSTIGQHRVVSIAAGVTFFALLAIFPAVGALVSIYGLFTDPAAIQNHLRDMSSFLPGGAIEILSDQMQRVAAGGKTRLGVAFLLALGLSLWSANAGMKALFDALNIVYDATERRGLIKLNAISLIFTAGALAVLLLAIAAVMVAPVALDYLALGTITETTVSLVRWPALFAAILLGLALMYRFGPDRDNAQWHWITWGSAIAALLWIVLSILFSWYAANFGSYNKTYGSLGAVIGFMTWIWISSIVILAGAEIDAVMERLDRGSAK